MQDVDYKLNKFTIGKGFEPTTHNKSTVKSRV